MKIISISQYIQSKEVENITFDSQNSLLDADVIILNPTKLSEEIRQKVEDLGGDYDETKFYDFVKRKFDRWQKEIDVILSNGKIIYIFFTPQVNVGRKYSYKSKNYYYLDNYSWLPSQIYNLIDNKITPADGEHIELSSDKHLFSQYFKAFKNELCYSSYINHDSDNFDIFLVNKSKVTIGFSIFFNGGLINFIPMMKDAISEMDEEISKKFIGIVLSSSLKFLNQGIETAEPDWVKAYSLSGQNTLEAEIQKFNDDISNLESGRLVQENLLKDLLKYKALLYEQGTPLEEAVIKSFSLLGFKAERYKKDDMEHDVIFESAEGKGIVEIEGKDNDAVHIDKLDQLTRVVDEYFHEKGEYPEGVLIGNPYRLKKLEERTQEPFTEKVLISAKRKNFGLLTTTELYKAVTDVLNNPADEDKKRKYREGILSSQGKIIKL